MQPVLESHYQCRFCLNVQESHYQCRFCLNVQQTKTPKQKCKQFNNWILTSCPVVHRNTSEQQQNTNKWAILTYRYFKDFLNSRIARIFKTKSAFNYLVPVENQEFSHRWRVALVFQRSAWMFASTKLWNRHYESDGKRSGLCLLIYELYTRLHCPRVFADTHHKQECVYFARRHPSFATN